MFLYYNRTQGLERKWVSLRKMDCDERNADSCISRGKILLKVKILPVN
jgi:hypothetical protein